MAHVQTLLNHEKRLDKRPRTLGTLLEPLDIRGFDGQRAELRTRGIAKVQSDIVTSAVAMVFVTERDNYRQLRRKL